MRLNKRPWTVRIDPVHRFTTRLTAVATLVVGICILMWLIIHKPLPHAATAQPQDGSPAVAQTETSAPPATPPPSLAEMIGLTAAQQRLGDAIPTGTGIAVGHVEGAPGQYMPDVNDPALRGITFAPRTGPSKVLGHATATAKVIYGPNGLAPGVTTVHNFAVLPWLTNAYLRAGLPVEPVQDKLRVFSHSWISDHQQGAEQVLRRIDYVIDAHDVIICAGVNNGRTTIVPRLLASAYNVIAVGGENGASSGGYTRIEAPDRCKPDIVGPNGKTSFTTPAVAACAARLLEAADKMTDAARRAEVIKAVLMAGASKPWNWNPEPNRPLDEHLGAGLVDFDASLRILSAGAADPQVLHRRDGWDFRSLSPNTQAIYRVEALPPLKEISILLTWHRRIDGQLGRDMITNQPRWIDTPRLANFDLRVVYVDDQGRRGVIDESVSRIDNVEHVYIKDPPPGQYEFQVIRRDDSLAEAWDYAIAWRTSMP